MRSIFSKCQQMTGRISEAKHFGFQRCVAAEFEGRHRFLEETAVVHVRDGK
jgi:hypothetical protein